jgi:cell division protein FtsB
MVNFMQMKNLRLKWRTVVICALCACVGVSGMMLAKAYDSGRELRVELSEYKDMYDKTAAEKAALCAVNTDLAAEKDSLEKEIKKLRPKAGKSGDEKKSSRSKKYKTKMKATWYTGDVLGFRGSYGKLTHGNTVALNASQRSQLGVKKKESVYLDFPGEHENLSGEYKVMDSGCSSGVVDLFFSSKSSVPKNFKRAGRVGGVKLYRYA